MRRAHGFCVPEEGSLRDSAGLFGFLQEKVCVRHACVCCHRRFRTLEGVRAHMLAKSHCRVRMDDDATLLELWPFYDLEDSWLLSGRPRLRVDALGELVLPSGTKLGHRSLQSAYRQRHRAEDTRLSVQAARRNLLRARLGGMRGTAFQGRLGAHASDGRAVWPPPPSITNPNRLPPPPTAFHHHPPPPTASHRLPSPSTASHGLPPPSIAFSHLPRSSTSPHRLPPGMGHTWPAARGRRLSRGLEARAPDARKRANPNPNPNRMLVRELTLTLTLTGCS
jgi:hypothetical protein